VFGASLELGILDLVLKYGAVSAWHFLLCGVTPLMLFENAGLCKAGI